ncbi:MAG: hypothetical protein MRY83_01375 [Flavobacteriales bacterium]|nr:hypothetical protein [Flavobacteriales bacterium]
MEAYLIENEDILILDDNNFSSVEVLDVELALKKSRRDRDGRIDILAKYGGEYLGIIELKKEEVNENSLSQLKDYLDQRNQILEIGGEDYWEEESEAKWIGVLIGESIDPLLQEKLMNGLDHNGIPIAGMTLRRFRSDQNEIFVISDTFFRFNYSTKDYSKFIFNGKEFNKGRLVNAVIKKYVESNPSVSYSQLKQAFPDNIQGSKFGVFDLKSNAEDIYSRWSHKRHYIKPDEVIELSDETISTCTQWNPVNIDKFIKRSKELGLEIELK